MLVRGRYEEDIAGHTLDYGPFQVGFHPPGIAHRDRIGPAGARFACLEIRSEPMRAFDARLAPSPGFLPADATLDLLHVWHALARGALTPIVLDSVTWALCREGQRDRPVVERGRPAWLTRCLALVDDACAEAWSVDAVARAVGVHPVHLSREFRRRFGETFGDYLQKARVRAACARIVEREEPLAVTATSVGFADQSHFCRVFKARVGCTPSAFAALASM